MVKTTCSSLNVFLMCLVFPELLGFVIWQALSFRRIHRFGLRQGPLLVRPNQKQFWTPSPFPDIFAWSESQESHKWNNQDRFGRFPLGMSYSGPVRSESVGLTLALPERYCWLKAATVAGLSHSFDSGLSDVFRLS